MSANEYFWRQWGLRLKSKPQIETSKRLSMGKKSRAKYNARALAAKKKRAKPDDYFQNGVFEMARFGKHVVMRNNMTPEQHKVFMRAMAARLPEVIAKIDGHVGAIVEIVSNYDPISLLQRGYWTSILPHIQPSKAGQTDARVPAQRMVDYVQSVIAAVSPKTKPAAAISDAAWADLSQHIEALFEGINRSYIQCRTADWKVNGGGPPEEQIEFYVRALAMWCNVTGHRYHFQEIGYLRELIAPHSEVFQRLWGIDAEGVLHGFEAILHALTRGLGEAMERITAEEQLYQVAKKQGGDQAAKQALDLLRDDASFKESLGRIFGVELFRIDRYLPATLLDDLSWSPGECLDFIDGRPQSGWPTRVWPRSRRPFLKIDGSHYCFDVHTLFDHIYRVLQRTVHAKEPNYDQKWNDRQKDVSEGLPFKLLGKLLPGAQSWRSVYYESDEVDEHGHAKWPEVDGLIVYDDHLFVVEVKGRTFTAASPEENFESYVNSVKRLIFEPVDQGARFLRRFDRRGSIELCDKHRCPLTQLSRRNFAHVTICAVNLDPFTELSAKAYHLRELVGRQETTRFWALSISDLLTYSELFENPLVFLHFVEKRNQATASSKVVLDDELDHYGMYLRHNNYDVHAEEIAGNSRVSWTGYRSMIDEYFDARVREEPAKLPRQDIPPLYWTVIEVLAGSGHQHRRKVASLLLDADGDLRKQIEEGLINLMRLQVTQRRPRPLSIGGEDVRFTFVCWQPSAVMPGDFDAAAHCKTSMLAAAEPDRWLIELHFNFEGALWRVEPTFFSSDCMSDSEKRMLGPRVEDLQIQRQNQVIQQQGKIGRNQLCPCGSGKKYKRCCGS